MVIFGPETLSSATDSDGAKHDGKTGCSQPSVEPAPSLAEGAPEQCQHAAWPSAKKTIPIRSIDARQLTAYTHVDPEVTIM